MQWKKNRKPSRRYNQDMDDLEDNIKEWFEEKDDSPLHNKIYLYEDVTPQSILRLNKQIDSLTKRLQILQINVSLPAPPVIELHICTDGGDLCAALSTADKISKNAVPVHTYCEGLVASAGTIISVCGYRRFISENSCMLIHQLSSTSWGNFEQLKDDMKNNEVLMKILKNVYLKKTSISEEDLSNVLKRDLFFTSEECLKRGLVDTIV